MNINWQALGDELVEVTTFPEEIFDFYEQLKEKIEDRVSEVFGLWCEIFNIHRAYGVSGWYIDGGSLFITQDVSACGCSNYRDRVLKARWLSIDNEEAIKQMKEMKTKNDKKEKRLRISEAERELKMAQNKIEYLKRNIDKANASQ